MSLKQVAETILGRRNGLTLAVNDHELKERLGHSGLTEALRRHWLEADEETGHLTMTRQMAKLDEMRQVAQLPEAAAEPAKSTACSGRDFLDLHRQSLGVSACENLTEADEDAEVGDEVVVADSGKSYQATVQAKKPDGKLVLSFGAAKPSASKDYAKGEYKVTKKTAKAQPTAAPAAAAGSPSAPGIGR